MSVVQRLKDTCARDNTVLLLSEEIPIKVTTRIQVPLQCACGTTFEKNVKSILKSYACCPACTLKRRQEKFRNTCMDRYGTPSPTQCPAIIAKRKPIENMEEINQKRFQTNLQRYGTPFVMQCKEIFEKRKQTMLEKYGTDIPKSSKNLEQKKLEAAARKIETILNKFEELRGRYILKPPFDFEN
jgi:hypothetical protein